MSDKKKKTGKTGAGNISLPNQAISAYEQGADPLGSYTGITEDMMNSENGMPRRTAEGKIYMRVDHQPVQDADDL